MGRNGKIDANKKKVWLLRLAGKRRGGLDERIGGRKMVWARFARLGDWEGFSWDWLGWFLFWRCRIGDGRKVGLVDWVGIGGSQAAAMGKAFKVKFGGWRRGFFEGGEGCGFCWVFWRFDKRSKDGLVTALFKEPLRLWQWRWILRHFLQSVAVGTISFLEWQSLVDWRGDKNYTRLCVV